MSITNGDSTERQRDEPPLLSTKKLSKSFAVPVLKKIDFELRKGEIHALMGSNGAGKSTLCNIISGIHQPSDGELFFNGQAYSPDSIKASEQMGVRMVMQELNLFSTLSIAENICFKSLRGDGFFGKAGVINKTRLKQQARSALSLLNLQHLDTDKPISQLGVGQQQLIEIASVIAEPVKLLILDEPTAALTDPEIEELFVQLKKLRNQGVGIIYISHRMDEIAQIADRVSVLRDGHLVATVNTGEVDSEQIVTLMAGELVTPALKSELNNDADQKTPEHKQTDTNSSQRTDTALLKAENLGIEGKFKEIDFEVNAGEVLGIGGLIGSGRTEILRAIFGADIAHTGGIRLQKDQFAQLHKMRSPKEAINAGIGMVVEDRKDQGLLLDCSITSNITLAGLPHLWGLLDKKSEQIAAKEISESVSVKYDDLNQPVSELSGGNQQKVLIARWLLKDLPILLFDEPSRGVDARAKATIQRLIREQAAQGKAVIVVSSETRELIDISDRVLVVSNGRLAGEFNADSLTEEQLLQASFKYYFTSETDSTENVSEPAKSTAGSGI